MPLNRPGGVCRDDPPRFVVKGVDGEIADEAAHVGLVGHDRRAVVKAHVGGGEGRGAAAGGGGGDGRCEGEASV